VSLSGSTRTGDQRPRIAHVIHHLSMGGLENGLVNLVNAEPLACYGHTIVCMAYADEFRNRIRRADVEVVSIGIGDRGWRRATGDLIDLFRRIRPAIVHSRNLSGLDSLLPAAIAGVPARIHGEHGWELTDVGRRNVKHEWLRRLHAPLVHRFVALSKHQEDYLRERVGIAPTRITQIYNGVDTHRFRLGRPGEAAPPGLEGRRPGSVTFGAILRMQGVKDPLNLVEAFIRLRRSRPAMRATTRLMLVVDGPLRADALRILTESGDLSNAWLPGAREDVPDLLRQFDVFVLPSQIEGISNTILEAMATGLPVIATNVGGNPELVLEGATGMLVPRSDPDAMAEAMASYAESEVLRKTHGAAGRLRVETLFSLDLMVSRYLGLYEGVLSRNRRPFVTSAGAGSV